MKAVLRYLWRSKIDLGIFISTIAAFAQWFILHLDLTYCFLLIIGYVFAAMMRFGIYSDRIMQQDQEIKALNERIFEKDKFIGELIRKYGNPKEGAAYMNKIKSDLTKTPK